MKELAGTKGITILFLGDIIAYVFSLIFSLAIRYGQIPSKNLLYDHLPAFSILIAIFVVINFSAGLYEKQSFLIKPGTRGLLLKVQLINAVIGVIFFYFAPVTIAPKTNLFIYFAVSTFILFIWRSVMFPVVSITRKQDAILVGEGDDISDLHEEVNGGSHYSLSFAEKIKPQSDVNLMVSTISDAVKRTNSSIIVADLRNSQVEEAMPYLYSLIFSGVQVLDAGKMYETVFGRIPLSMLGERWFVENSSTALANRRIYDGLKRLIDILVSIVGGLLSLIFYPFVCLAIKFEDRGPIFIVQKRIGKNGKLISIIKFRSMSGNDEGKYGKTGATSNKITKVGSFIRKSRIDELPQFWNVLIGDLSMVGPRPELPVLSGIYESQIPYYNARHLVKPGLFGWAQIYHEAHPHHAVATEDTKDKLSYDLYYIKNRSLALDTKITFRTMQILMRRVGR